jgi:hypothetical protein
MVDSQSLQSQIQSILNELSDADLQQWLEVLQSSRRKGDSSSSLTQVNLGNAKGFQVKVTGGVA